MPSLIVGLIKFGTLTNAIYRDSKVA